MAPKIWGAGEGWSDHFASDQDLLIRCSACSMQKKKSQWLKIDKLDHSLIRQSFTPFPH